MRSHGARAQVAIGGLVLMALVWSAARTLSHGTLLAAPQARAPESGPGKVYGEWRIRILPDKGKAYAQLIAEKGLPLFREAGGRMVGWWTTLVGNLYEHVTIWEYDSMAAFEKAVGFLGKEERFAQFVTARDPLLDGEDCRFLRLASYGEPPSLPEKANVVVHETHRVGLKGMDRYLAAMKEALPQLKKFGFRVAGPFRVELGQWTEVTYLFFYQSLEERERLKAVLDANADSIAYMSTIREMVTDVRSQALLPAPFAR